MNIENANCARLLFIQVKPLGVSDLHLISSGNNNTKYVLKDGRIQSQIRELACRLFISGERAGVKVKLYFLLFYLAQGI